MNTLMSHFSCFYFFNCVCICAWVGVPTIQLWGSEDNYLSAVGSLFPLRGLQESNLGHQAWWQVPSPAKSSCWFLYVRFQRHLFSLNTNCSFIALFLESVNFLTASLFTDLRRAVCYAM